MPELAEFEWPTSKLVLYSMGVQRVKDFCTINSIVLPEFNMVHGYDWNVNACAYYRPYTIHLCLDLCGYPCSEANSQNWTWPGSTTDREPFGVVAHELGHHVDLLVSSPSSRRSYMGDYSEGVFKESNEEPISGYDGDVYWEWFAEMFRVFVTNHALLEKLRPRTHEILMRTFQPVSSDDWLRELGSNVPKRVVAALERKMR